MRPFCKDVPVILEGGPLLVRPRTLGRRRSSPACGTRPGWRDPGPELLIGLADEGLLTRWAARRWLGDGMGSGCEYPEAALDTEVWAELFVWVGYTVDGKRAALPETPLALYRGAPRDPDWCRYGMSWTDSLELARWFAARAVRLGAHSSAGVVWTASVEPWRLYARNLSVRLGEPEYVVNTVGLDVTELAIVRAGGAAAHREELGRRSASCSACIQSHSGSRVAVGAASAEARNAADSRPAQIRWTCAARMCSRPLRPGDSGSTELPSHSRMRPCRAPSC